MALDEQPNGPKEKADLSVHYDFGERSPNIRHYASYYDRIENVPTTVAWVCIIGLCANTVIVAHFLAHFASNLGLTRFLTSLLTSACGLIIVNSEGLLLILNAILPHEAFYWLVSSTVYQVSNVVLQAATLFLLHFICVMSFLRVFCQPRLNSAARTCKISFGTLVALLCTASIGLLANWDCYYKFNATLWYFSYKCAGVLSQFSPANVLNYEPLALCAVCLILFCCGALCSVQKYSSHTAEPSLCLARSRPCESAVLDPPGMPIMSSAESTKNKSPTHERRQTLVQTNILGLLFFLLIDALICVALQYQAQLAYQIFGTSVDGDVPHAEPIPLLKASEDGTTVLSDEESSNFTFNNLNFVDRRVESLALVLNCAHLALIGIALPLCHFSANARLRAGLVTLLKAGARLATCRASQHSSNYVTP